MYDILPIIANIGEHHYIAYHIIQPQEDTAKELNHVSNRRGYPGCALIRHPKQRNRRRNDGSTLLLLPRPRRRSLPAPRRRVLRRDLPLHLRGGHRIPPRQTVRHHLRRRGGRLPDPRPRRLPGRLRNHRQDRGGHHLRGNIHLGLGQLRTGHTRRRARRGIRRPRQGIGLQDLQRHRGVGGAESGRGPVRGRHQGRGDGERGYEHGVRVRVRGDRGEDAVESRVGYQDQRQDGGREEGGDVGLGPTRREGVRYRGVRFVGGGSARAETSSFDRYFGAAFGGS